MLAVVVVGTGAGCHNGGAGAVSGFKSKQNAETKCVKHPALDRLYETQFETQSKRIRNAPNAATVSTCLE